MTVIRVIGVDPGPTPGLVQLDFLDGQLGRTSVVQCSANVLTDVFLMLLGDPGLDMVRYVQVEHFVMGGRRGQTSQQTRGQIDALRAYVISSRVFVRKFSSRPSASNVKPWATDERLGRTPLLEATKGMRHARDAARHALYCAVYDAQLPDPMSKTARYR